MVNTQIVLLTMNYCPRRWQCGRASQERESYQCQCDSSTWLRCRHSGDPEVQEEIQLWDSVRCTVGSQPADRNWEWSHAARQVNINQSKISFVADQSQLGLIHNESEMLQVWTRQGLSADLQEKVPADGGAGGSEHPRDHLWEEEQSARLLSLLAQE